MSASPKPTADEPIAGEPAPSPVTERQVFRRRSTVISSLVLSGLLVVVAAVLTPSEIGHGFFPAIVAFIGILPLVVLALAVGAWPHVIVDEDHVEVHNTFIWYDIPYAAIGEIKQIRMGLILRTHAGKVIPMTAYASGSAGRLLGHGDVANVVIHAVQNKMEFLKAEPEHENTRAARHVETRNIIAVLASIALATAVVYAAAHTYR